MIANLKKNRKISHGKHRDRMMVLDCIAARNVCGKLVRRGTKEIHIGQKGNREKSGKPTCGKFHKIMGVVRLFNCKNYGRVET